MKVEIRNRWTNSVIFTAEISDDVPEQFRIRAAVELAVSQRASLSAANLRAANLSAADLSDAKNSTAEQLVQIRDDLWAVLSAAPREVDGLRKALAEGRVDGSTYTGECACLVGTIANVRGCSERELGILKPNSSRPIERWFMGIKKGDTPENNVCAKWVLAWTDEWVANMKAAFSVQS